MEVLQKMPEENPKPLKIEFLKVNATEKVLGQDLKDDLRTKIEEIKAIYERKIIAIEDDDRYKEYCEKIDNSKSDITINKLIDMRDKYYLSLVERIEAERDKKLRSLENAVYGNKNNIKVNIVDNIGEKFDIKCIYAIEDNELEIKRDKLINSIKSMYIDSIAYCQFLLLKVLRLRDHDNFREQLKIEIKKLKYNKDKKDNPSEEANGVIYSYMSELEKKLLDLIDYGVELSRQEITEIRRIIKSNYDIINVEEVDLGDELKLSYICEYIDEKGIGTTKINEGKSNEKSLYLIPSKDFDAEFKDYKNTVDLMGRLIKEGIVEFSKGRRRYKYTDGDYYIAIKAENEIVLEHMNELQGNKKDSVEDSKNDAKKQGEDRNA